ncbi:hypothetical protein PAXINDRAFT_172352 [Paxillus involutus ATCC 200175]|uniref:Unplaced genomic scaffold PAXINscaffold_113, whole genome shotgun sequence n=1 Tax=Paxillus involutus ATCC 200175 TaxID=664439 RepID=A0A0C9TPU2_PAXIN|nr:hypothetical protein PAXINDRAFT_172352 [Paxillus involutus ATCC 200175]
MAPYVIPACSRRLLRLHIRDVVQSLDRLSSRRHVEAGYASVQKAGVEAFSTVSKRRWSLMCEKDCWSHQ